jgi:outer membrane lipoprotein-sorting protein
MKNNPSGLRRSRKSLSCFLTLLSIIAFIPASLATAGDLATAEPDPISALEASLEIFAGIDDYTAKFLKQEYIDDELLPLETIALKYRSPQDVYMKWIGKPYRGQEVLYRKGKNKGRITAHKGGFLGLVSLNLNPTSNMALEGNHHPVFDLGIENTTILVLRGLSRGKERNELKYAYKGILTIDGRKAKHFEAVYTDRCVGATHRVEEGETLWDIARKYDQDMYVILFNNDDVDSPADIEPGQEILVPYHYCKKSDIYIDEELGILVKLDNYDWNDKLYERYIFNDIRINAGLTDADFDEGNSEYNF